MTSDLHKIDAIYGTGNSVLCTAACPCDANPKDWAYYNASLILADTLTGAATGADSTATGVITSGMVTGTPNYENYPQCPGANETLQAFIAANFSGSGANMQLGLNVLDAVERDFDCAGMCYSSVYYTFSQVSDGPPERTCEKGIEKVLNKAATITKVSGIIFLIFTLLGFIMSFFLIFRKKDDIEEPLLY